MDYLSAVVTHCYVVIQPLLGFGTHTLLPNLLLTTQDSLEEMTFNAVFFKVNNVQILS